MINGDYNMWVKSFNTIEEALTAKQEEQVQLVKHQEEYQFFAISDVQENASYEPYTGFPFENYNATVQSHALRQLSIPETKVLPIYSIDYKVALKTGIRLVPYYTISNDGLLTATTYYLEGVYPSGIAYKRPIIQVSEEYTYHASDSALNPSEKTIVAREKKWQYYFEDGTLDTRTAYTKIKRKIYQTNQEFLEVGKRRRYNIKSVYSERIGALLVILGICQDDAVSTARQKANDQLRQFSKAHAVDFMEYENYATTDLYDAIANDTHFAWLNTTVPTAAGLQESLITQGQPATAAIVQADAYAQALAYYQLEDAVGSTLRDYSIAKLKGTVN